MLDPQGKAVKPGLSILELKEVEEVRKGKHMLLELEAQNKNAANARVKEA